MMVHQYVALFQCFPLTGHINCPDASAVSKVVIQAHTKHHGMAVPKDPRVWPVDNWAFGGLRLTGSLASVSFTTGETTK
jgi:hypothetical protein